MITFETLIKNEKLKQAIEEIGYIEPTKIQMKAIPLVTAGKDMIAKSNTGTGKTAAFGLPLLEKIADQTYHKCIVICPTRELVQQAETELCRFKKHLKDIHVVSVYGGASIEKQIKELKKGYEIVVGTPGRLLDHIRRKTIQLEDVDCVVLDEADEMLNMGFIEDIEVILSNIKKPHQTLMFSATMPKEIKRIAETYLHDKAEIEVRTKQKTVDKITQYYYDVKRDEKVKAVKQLLEYYDSDLCIIFCNTKAKVDELCEELNKTQRKAVALHGDIKQERRTKIMNAFKKAKQQILIASDVAARGIDVNNINLVINYDIPQEKEIYVHRIGRTGRAGKEGLAVSLVQSSRQYRQLKQIMNYTKAEIQKKQLPSEADLLQKRKEKLKEEIKMYAQNGIIQEHLQLANELIKEGLAVEEIISALVSTAFGGTLPTQHKQKKTLPNGIELKFSLGKVKGITANDIEKSILGKCALSKDDIGCIDVRRMYSIVTVKKKAAEKVITYMHKSKIANKRCEVDYYKKKKVKK